MSVTSRAFPYGSKVTFRRAESFLKSAVGFWPEQASKRDGLVSGSTPASKRSPSGRTSSGGFSEWREARNVIVGRLDQELRRVLIRPRTSPQTSMRRATLRFVH